MERKIVDREFGLRGRGQPLAISGLLLLLVVVGLVAYLGDTKAVVTLVAATIVGVTIKPLTKTAFMVSISKHCICERWQIRGGDVTLVGR